MNQQLQHLQQRADDLAQKLAALTNLAQQITNQITNASQDTDTDNDQHDTAHTLNVHVDTDGDFLCDLNGDSITLLTPEDVVTLARWLNATIHCSNQALENEIKEAERSQAQ